MHLSGWEIDCYLFRVSVLNKRGEIGKDHTIVYGWCWVLVSKKTCLMSWIFEKGEEALFINLWNFYSTWKFPCCLFSQKIWEDRHYWRWSRGFLLPPHFFRLRGNPHQAYFYSSSVNNDRRHGGLRLCLGGDTKYAAIYNSFRLITERTFKVPSKRWLSMTADWFDIAPDSTWLLTCDRHLHGFSHKPIMEISKIPGIRSIPRNDDGKIWHKMCRHDGGVCSKRKYRKWNCHYLTFLNSFKLVSELVFGNLSTNYSRLKANGRLQIWLVFKRDLCLHLSVIHTTFPGHLLGSTWPGISPWLLPLWGQLGEDTNVSFSAVSYST